MTDWIYRGDLLPVWSATLEQAQGVPLPLATNGATSVRLIGTLSCSDTPIIDAIIPGPYVDGYIERPWVAGETATAGVVAWKVIVTWPGEGPQTIIPNSTTIRPN